MADKTRGDVNPKDARRLMQESSARGTCERNYFGEVSLTKTSPIFSSFPLPLSFPAFFLRLIDGPETRGNHVWLISLMHYTFSQRLSRQLNQPTKKRKEIAMSDGLPHPVQCNPGKFRCLAALSYNSFAAPFFHFFTIPPTLTLRHSWCLLIM